MRHIATFYDVGRVVGAEEGLVVVFLAFVGMKRGWEEKIKKKL